VQSFGSGAVLNELLEHILTEKKIAFAVFRADYKLEDYSRYFTKLVDAQVRKTFTTLWDLFPELVGCEVQVDDIYQGKQKRYSLERISKFSDTHKLRYYNLTLLHYKSESDNKLLCILNDSTVETSLEQRIQQQMHEIKSLESTLASGSHSFGRNIIGESPRIEIVRQFIQRISEIKSSTILLEGETGTGKNLVARLIHRNSVLANAPFVEVNCASIPATLIESEIFGYEKGAFTNATSAKRGLLEAADSGTFFLDEISELPIALQSKFLSFWETKTFRRLGNTQERTVTVRIIAATNRDLQQAVARGEFRQDLYYRLNVLSLKLPPLRDLENDILTIADYFIQLYAFDFKKKAARLNAAARDKLLHYHWPGNVRELRNVIERAVIFSDGEEIDAAHLLLADERKPEALPSTLAVSERPNFNVEKMERELIRQALVQCRGNRTKAAHLLGLTLDTLRYRLKKYDIII
jgi:transcriptional regulator with PAS, ATPase and Fis domain